MDVQEALRERISSARKSQGMTMTALGEEVGLHRAAVSAIESGKRSVTIGFAEKAAEALGLPWSELFDGIGPQRCSKKSPKKNPCTLMDGHEGLHESEVGERWL